jgi:thioredoxin-related protein
MNTKTYLLTFFLIISTAGVYSQKVNPDGSMVNWLQLEEAMLQYKKVPKPLLVDFYTDWCGWCKHMMKTTYADPGLATYINNYFYAVKFNAEGKDTVGFLGKNYKPTSPEPKSPHELAEQMLHGNLVYPSTVFLNALDPQKNEFTLNLNAPGYLDREKIEPILVFTLENVFRNSNYEDFSLNFTKAFRDSTLQDRINKMEWKAPVQFFNPSVNIRTKTLVFINTTWCNSCRVMQRTSFTDSLVFAYADTTFDFVDFNPEATDSLFYKGQWYSNPRNPQSPFHQLSFVLARNNFVIPTLAILDEEMNVIDAIPYYLPPKLLNDILKFYGNDIYKSKSWAEYYGMINQQ